MLAVSNSTGRQSIKSHLAVTLGIFKFAPFSPRFYTARTKKHSILSTSLPISPSPSKERGKDIKKRGEAPLKLSSASLNPPQKIPQKTAPML
jgi:hypothetical protein